MRLATAAASDDENTVNVFLIGEAVYSAVGSLAVPEGRDNIPWMLSRLAAGRRKIAVCRTCMDRRGIREAELLADACRSTLEELARWTAEADKVLVF